MSWWEYIFVAIGIGCILLFALTPIITLIITIAEFFKRDIRERRFKRLEKWLEEMRPNKTQKGTLTIFTIIAVIFFLLGGFQ